MAIRILFVDDNPSDLPTDHLKNRYERRFHAEVLSANPRDPIASALSILREEKAVTAVVTDSCDQPDLQHLSEFRKAAPHLRIALHSGALTEASRKLAIEMGADQCIDKDDVALLEKFLADAANPYEAARRQFEADLPELLAQSSLKGKWVAYNAEGWQGGPADDELTLVHQFVTSSNAREYFFARVLPNEEAVTFARPYPFSDAL